MYLLDLSRQLIKQLWRTKLQTALGLFGIFWGTTSVILLLSLGAGYYKKSVQNLSSLSNGASVFFVGYTNMPYQGYPSGRQVIIKSKDLIHLQKEVVGLKYLTPVVREKATVTHGGTTTRKRVTGVTESYPLIWDIASKERGQFFAALDVKQKNHVAFLGNEVAKELFKNQNPIGQTVYIWSIPFRVTGFFSRSDSSGDGGWSARQVYIPYTTFESIRGEKPIRRFNILPWSVLDTDYVKKEIRNDLGSRMHFNPSDNGALNSPDFLKQMRFFDTFFTAIQYFLGFCGFMTLLVGGIGVANMMFLVITEKTREFGLRMALGARPSSIIGLVLFETGLMVFIGGLAGIAFSEMIVSALSVIPLPGWLGVPTINYSYILVVVLILSMITIGSGIFPAINASKMNPVKALSN